MSTSAFAYNLGTDYEWHLKINSIFFSHSSYELQFLVNLELMVIFCLRQPFNFATVFQIKHSMKLHNAVFQSSRAPLVLDGTVGSSGLEVTMIEPGSDND